MTKLFDILVFIFTIAKILPPNFMKPSAGDVSQIIDEASVPDTQELRTPGSTETLPGPRNIAQFFQHAQGVRRQAVKSVISPEPKVIDAATNN